MSRYRRIKKVSTKKLKFLQILHISPINVRVFHGFKEFVLKKVSRLICFQRFSYPNVAPWQCSWLNNQSTRGWILPVLSYKEVVFSILARTPGRIQTVSRRSKLNSGTIFIGEQPNPWDLLQPQDMISQHRGAKQFRR